MVPKKKKTTPAPKLEFAAAKQSLPLPPPPPPPPPAPPLPRPVHGDEGRIKLTLLAGEEGDEEVVSVSVLDSEPCSVLLGVCEEEFASSPRPQELRVGQRVLDLNAPLREQVQTFDLILARAQTAVAAHEND